MEKLITSADPLLSLAGVVFVMGVAFDIVFSSQFKDRIKQTITKSYLKDLRFSQLLTEYSRFFVVEILSFNRISVFIIKSAFLSVLFYLFVAFFEARINPIQNLVFVSIALLTPSIVLLFIFQIMFDIFSSFVSVVYIQLIGRNRRIYQITILLISNVLISACLWSLFFSYAIALHLKVADLEKRRANIALEIERNPQGAGFSGDNFYNSNATLRDKAIVQGSLLNYDSDEQLFYSFEGGTRPVIAISNIKDDKIVFQKFLETISKLHEPGGELSSKVNVAAEKYYSQLVVSNVIGRREFAVVFSNSVAILNPMALVFQQLGTSYYAIKKTYATMLESYDAHLLIADLALFCDDKFSTITSTEANTYDFSSCATYFITPKSTARYIVLWTGRNFSNNSVFSHGAFFWSSMALTLSFYFLLMAMILLKVIKHFFSWNVLNNIFNLERGFFTCIFAIPSTAILAVFLVKTLAKI